jgi:two-component system NtrC family sensor kinase
MTTDACSLHIVEQARAAGDKVVLDISPLGWALPSRPLPLSRRFGGPHVAIMAPVKVGTRLTLVLLLALTPTVALYTYWSTTRSTRTYIDDLKRETRATSRALGLALENDLGAREWDQIDRVLQRMSAEGTLGALFSPEGKPLYAATGFPPGLAPSTEKFGLSASRGFVEYEAAVNGRRWFCRLSPLKQPDQMIIGHLLVAQDWSDIREDLRARTLGSMAAAIVVVTLIAALIPLAIRRYISNPLRELSRRVTRLSSGDELNRGIGGDEVKLLSEEFHRLDHQLTKAGADLMERHRRELELERRLQHADRLATIGTLASGLAHEIGTPMGVIRARAEYLLHSELGAWKQQEGLEIIIKQIDRISRIVRMLLDYARNRESTRAVCDLRAIVQHALSLVETEVARRNIQLIAELGDQPLTVQCDADQLVFVNLAINALDPMAATGGRLRVLAESGAGEDRSARITFADTGPGIAAVDRSRVFDPFFTTKEPGKGTGMGLAVSQSIMRDHGGEISFESASDGTRFFVTMPVAAAITDGTRGRPEGR